jgi:hypothetical protein
MADSLDRLKSQLLTSGLQQENYALFQVISQLIDYLRGNINATQAALTGGGGGGGGGGILGATYLTKNLEPGLPNSKQEIAGAGIQFNDALGRRIISTAIPFGMDGEQGEEGVPGPPGRIGIDGAQGIDGMPGFSMLAIDGEDGIDGDPGQAGATGGAGPIGAAGAPGIPGLDGIDGEEIESMIPGPQGPQGLTGGNSGVRFWFDPTDASDIAGYKKALLNPSTNAESTVIQVCAGAVDNLLYSFVTEPGIPGVYTIPPGAGFRHIHGAVTTVAGFARYLVKFYYCNADGTGETLVGSSYSDPTTDTSIDEVNWDLYNLTTVNILPTQRLVWKLYVARVSGPANVSVTTYFEGLTHPSYVESTIAGLVPGATGPMGMQGPSGGPFPTPEPEEPEPSYIITLPASPGINILRTLANQTINGGAATYVNITGLTFPVVNGRDYAFYFYIVFRSAATATGWKGSVNHPGGTVDHFANVQTIANAAAGAATWLHKHNTGTDEMTQLTATVTLGVDLVFMIQGRYQCTAGGTFAARFANELNANTDIVVQKGSWGFWF